jgi:hypothetical protein
MRLERCVGCPNGTYLNQTSRSCWKTDRSQEKSEFYDIVKPVKELDVEVAPLKGKVIKKQIITKRRSTEREESAVLSPLTGKKIIRTTTSRLARSSKSRNEASGSEGAAEASSSSSRNARRTATSSTRGSSSADDTISPVRSAPITRTVRTSSSV